MLLPLTMFILSEMVAILNLPLPHWIKGQATHTNQQQLLDCPLLCEKTTTTGYIHSSLFYLLIIGGSRISGGHKDSCEN